MMFLSMGRAQSCAGVPVPVPELGVESKEANRALAVREGVDPLDLHYRLCA